jgi:hypothetical protein
MRYILPKSLTWWAGAGLVITGFIRGLGAAIDLGSVGAVIDAWSGALPPSVLILQGAGLIGLRSAIKVASNG